MLFLRTIAALVTHSKKWGSLLLVLVLGREAGFAQNTPDSASGLGVFGNLPGIYGCQ